jgi:hypothetical protein
MHDVVRFICDFVNIVNLRGLVGAPLTAQFGTVILARHWFMIDGLHMVRYDIGLELTVNARCRCSTKLLRAPDAGRSVEIFLLENANCGRGRPCHEMVPADGGWIDFASLALRN